MTPAAELRREFGQLATDVAERLEIARGRGDRRAIDFLSGQQHAYRRTLDDLKKVDGDGRP